MQNLEPSSSFRSSAVFHLWITQWRLGILVPNEAMLVLRMVLRDLHNSKADDPFWKFLEQFLGPSRVSTGMSRPKDKVKAEQLLHDAWSLPPHRAKALLDYLSRCYALNGDDLEFWRAVRAAIELQEAPDEASYSNCCRASEIPCMAAPVGPVELACCELRRGLDPTIRAASISERAEPAGKI
jgi:hypothetical protein